MGRVMANFIRDFSNPMPRNIDRESQRYSYTQADEAVKRTENDLAEEGRVDLDPIERTNRSQCRHQPN
jgi:hypothetical protein